MPDVFAAMLWVLKLGTSGHDSAAALRRQRRLAGNAARHDDAHRAPHGTCESILIVRSRVTFRQPFSQSILLFSSPASSAPALDLHALEHYVGDEHAFSEPIHLVQFMKIHG